MRRQLNRQLEKCAGLVMLQKKIINRLLVSIKESQQEYSDESLRINLKEMAEKLEITDEMDRQLEEIQRQGPFRRMQTRVRKHSRSQFKASQPESDSSEIPDDGELSKKCSA